MADFLTALEYVLENEGFWSNHQCDPGGATKWGITLKLAEKYGIKGIEELAKMKQRERDFIYKSEFWRFDGLNSQKLATKTFDFCVNSGLKAGINGLQACLRKLRPIPLDGIYGPITEREANAVDPNRLITLLCDYQRMRYLMIIQNNPKMAVFKNGWMKRAERVPND